LLDVCISLLAVHTFAPKILSMCAVTFLDLPVHVFLFSFLFFMRELAGRHYARWMALFVHVVVVGFLLASNSMITP
jgi:hypothetical protein